MIIRLNLILNDKTHITKRETQELLEYQPVVIIAIESVALIVIDEEVLVHLMALYDWQISISFGRGFVLGYNHFVTRKDVWISDVVPQDVIA
jgi:hypothetical protein